MSYPGPLVGDPSFEHLHRGSRNLLAPQGSLTLNQHKEIEDEVEAYLEYQAEKEELDRQEHVVRIETAAADEVTAAAGAADKQCAGIRGGVKHVRRTIKVIKDEVRDYTSLVKGGLRRGLPSSASTSKLDKAAKEALVTEVMETTDMDNFRLMQKLAERLDAVGLKMPSVEVRFSGVTASCQVHTGSRSLPTLTNAARGMAESMFAPLIRLFSRGEGSGTKTLVMLDNVSGVLKPGRLTLLLGPPGAGKSTLLKVLSGQMKDKDVKVEGEVLYNGVAPSDFVVERTAAYVDQVDRHIAEMTVRETMAFSAKMMGQGHKEDPVYAAVLAREKERGITPDPKLVELSEAVQSHTQGDNIIVDIISRLLGLDVCVDTVVGNDLLKGISGGQKKRVTTAELMVGRLPCLFMDEISTGLDSASTFLISKALKNLCAFVHANIIVALLQPSPETYDIFDDIMLMGDGRIMYHGPRAEVLPFFASLGLSCPRRKAVADFLQEVTSPKDQPQYFTDGAAGRKFLSTSDIAAAFQASPQGVARAAELAAPGKYSELDMTKLVKKEEKYALSNGHMLPALLQRELLLMVRNKIFVVARAIQTLVMAFMVSTTFVRYPKDTYTDANAFMSISFFSLMYMLLSGFAEVPIFISRLPVFYKQRNYNFYPPWAYCLSGAVVRIPDNFLMTTLWVIMVYWSTGFTAAAGQFFIFYLIMFAMTVFSTAVFRTLAAITREEVVAQAMGAVMLVLTINTCGFTLARTSIPDWWIWMYWISPLAYAVRGMMVNEMNTSDWDTELLPGVSLGTFAMESRGFQTQTWWVWVSVGVLLGASIILTVLQGVVLTVMDARKEGEGAALAEEPEEDPATAQAKTSLAFTPFTLAFRGIKYHVPKPGGRVGEELTLLKSIDGCFRPGVLTALMGASGAGKTTLMDVLAGRKTGGRIEGEMLLNGHPKVQATFARVMGYVEQFDLHSPQATVVESLMFSGSMRLPEEMGKEAVAKFVHEVMELVELTPLAHAVVGLPGVSGLSVEQRKRLTIAVELVANPSVVFMDEPTSGLDARAAAIVMRVVRNTVNTGRTVVCTIHQPSLDIFQAFDELLLLKRGGETIFFGNMGAEQATLIGHFEAVEEVAKFVPGYNPANWMLEVTAPGAEKKLGVDFAQIYRESPLNKSNHALLDQVCEPLQGSQPLTFDKPFSVSEMTQFKLLIRRNLTTYWRSPNYNLIRFLITIFCGLVFGSLYWDIGTDRSSLVSLLNIMGALYSSAIFMGVANAITVLAVVNNERVVYYREKASGMYSPLPYAVAQGMVELPYLAVQAVVYALLIYWMVGFEANAAKFFWFLLFLFLNFMAFTFFGIMSVNMMPSVQLATVFAAFFFSVWNLFCGFLQSQPDIPGWWIWMYYINPVAYTLYGLIVSQLGDIYDEYINAASPGEPPFMVPVADYVESVFGYKHKMVGYLVLIMFAFIATFRVAAMTALFKLNFQKR